MKITRLEIKDYRGVKALATNVGPAGVVVKGANAKGKTTAIRAITAALAAKGCEPDDIRHGADSAEILVNLDGLRVRRSITAKGTSLTVTNKDGDKWAKPQTRLDELLGTSPIDALDFFLAPKPKRRQLVLDALPIAVTPDDVARWTGDAEVAAALGTDGHGLEVLARYHRHFYESRTDANRRAKDAAREADEAAVDQPISEPPAKVAEALAAAEAVRERAREAVHELEGREREVGRMRDRTAGTRGRVKQLREEAKADRESQPPAPSDDEVSRLRQEENAAGDEVRELERHVARARERMEACRAKVTAAETATKMRGVADERAAGLERQAAELEATLDAAGASGPTPEEKDAATRAMAEADQAVAEAQANVSARALWDRAVAANAARDATRASCERLDRVVRRLTDEAPAELVARAGAVPGLGVDGDRISLNGVEVDDLSGMEQMRFAVMLARRFNEKSKILVVDGLERLDAVQGVAFVKEATADGWQLFATRVADGELVVEAIEV